MNNAFFRRNFSATGSKKPRIISRSGGGGGGGYGNGGNGSGSGDGDGGCDDGCDIDGT